MVSGLQDLSGIESPLRAFTTRGSVVALFLIVVGVLGLLSVTSTAIAVFAALFLLVVAAAFVDFALIPVLAIPATLVMVRVGGFLSVSDVVLAGALPVALLLISRRDAIAMQPLIWLAISYLATLVPTLVLNPYKANFVEWAHETVLVIGGLLVGFIVGREGYARLSVSLYVLGCCGIAVAAAIVSIAGLAAHGHLAAAYLPYMHKNFIGNSLAFAFVIAFARPDWIGWTRRWAFWAMGMCAVGIAASQSRQAIASLVVGILVVVVMSRRGGVQTKLVMLASIPAAWFVIHAVSDQLSSHNRFNSVNQRLSWYQDSINVFHQSPLFGVGLRWWYTSRFPVSFQPPNAELEMMTVGGLLGLFGFLVLFFGAFWVLWHMDRRFGTVAMAVVVTRFTQGQFDLYWVAGQATFLWMIAGMAYGAQALDKAHGVRARDPDHMRRAAVDHLA